MSATALIAKEVTEALRPAGKISGTIVAGIALSVLAGAAATAFIGFFIAGDAPSGLGRGAAAGFATMVGLLVAAFGAFSMSMNLAVDTVAGERERHTLETLLAGPLDDTVILLSKLLAISISSGVIGLIGGLAVAAVSTILYGWWGLLWGLIGLLVVPLVQAVPFFVINSWIIVVTMRAKTTKDAGQRSVAIILPPLLGIQFWVMGSAGLAPSAGLIGGIVIAAIGLGLAILGPVLALVLFRRHRLIV